MLDKDKIILVFYLKLDENAFKLKPTQYMTEFRAYILGMFDETVLPIIIPCFSGLNHTKVECLKPEVLTKEQFDKLEDFQKKFANYIENKDLDLY